MKKCISLNEILWSVTFLGLAGYFLSKYLMIASIVSLVIISFLKNAIWSKGLPAYSSRTPFGFIEPHIGQICGTRKRFIEICIEILNISKEENRQILANTSLVSEKKLKKYLTHSVEILKPSLIQRFDFFVGSLIYHKPKNANCLRFLIDLSKLSNEEYDNLLKKLLKLQSISHNNVRKKELL